MLRARLEAQLKANTSPGAENRGVGVSGHFSQPFWSKFYDIECELNDELRGLDVNVPYIYNPVEYAGDLHCAYLRKYLKGPKALMFVGMNPGPNGMGQNGVPFGNIKTVKELMGLEGSVQQPLKVHPKRPVTGLGCTIEEPSGERFWGVLNKLSGGLDVFSVNCFMHNFCPLAFFDASGKNITPGELKGDKKNLVRDICLKYFEKELQLVNPSIVVAVGTYVDDCFKNLSKQYKDIRFLKLAHPSPRSLNNTNWPEKAEIFFKENDLMKYLRNEI
ncbi:unnamed protein product [Hermetia illucens]|uniref:Uracil-DNA glycosylase-like domain-containing protein n=2 Tax=Hermetia illucens TaxID=343691 RepID=A0A7R8V3C7_HERIL|nr:unnamed protein product [Hermetia illucens]